MSRATSYLMDADCLHGFSPTQSLQAGAKKKNNSVVHTLLLWQERSRQRGELRKLAESPELLKDTNLSFNDVQHEGSKPFWRK